MATVKRKVGPAHIGEPQRLNDGKGPETAYDQAKRLGLPMPAPLITKKGMSNEEAFKEWYNERNKPLTTAQEADWVKRLGNFGNQNTDVAQNQNTNSITSLMYQPDANGSLAYSVMGDQQNGGMPSNDPMHTANQAVAMALEFGKQYGVAPMLADKIQEQTGSKVQKALLGEKVEKKLPTEPGFVYMTHLFNMANGAQAIKDKKKKQDDVFVFTEQPEAVKTAIQLMGIQSDKNPGGLPIDFNEAMKVYFGDDDKLDQQAIDEWKTGVEAGDATIDPKRVRKFTNYDGSITWEILNQDKTVASRFTIGNYSGKKVFAQGGYQNFLKTMDKAKKEIGPDLGSEFDWMRKIGLKA